MNKFSKVILILAISLLGIGIACTAAAFVMGASIDSVRNVTVHFDDVKRLGMDHHFLDIDIDFLDDLEETTSKEKLSEMSSFKKVQNINLEAGASSIEVLYADVEDIEVHYEDAVGMQMELDEEELDIECHSSGNVEILIPEGTWLESVDLDIGAGQVKIYDIYFRNLDADIGAGELVIQTPEEQNAYNYNVDCALGEVRIGDATYAGISSTDQNQGGSRYMDIDCGTGRVEIQFSE